MSKVLAVLGKLDTFTLGLVPMDRYASVEFPLQFDLPINKSPVPFAFHTIVIMSEFSGTNCLCCFGMSVQPATVPKLTYNVTNLEILRIP